MEGKIGRVPGRLEHRIMIVGFEQGIRHHFLIDAAAAFGNRSKQAFGGVDRFGHQSGYDRTDLPASGTG